MRNNLFGILSAVVLALAPFQAAHGARDATDATYYTLNTANGLSSNRVLQMAQLDDGRIVVYSGSGIDVYDGQRFTRAPVADSGWVGLPAYCGHTHLYVDSGDMLWIKEHRRMTCVDLRRMRQCRDLARKLGDDVADFFVDSRRRRWVVRADSLCLDGGRLALGLPAGAGRLQDMDAVGGVVYAFFGTGRVVEYSEGGRMVHECTPFAGDEWRGYRRTSLLAAWRDSVFYQVRTGGRGSVLLAYMLGSRAWRTVMKVPTLLHTLTVTPQGIIYATCPNGFLRIDPSTGECRQHRKLRLPDGSMLATGINTVCLDREGGVWLGTYASGLLYTSPYSGLFDTSPVDIRLTPILASVYLNGREVVPGRSYGGRVVLDVTPPYVDDITLSYGQNSVAFRFSTMNYVRPRSTCYRYRFSGDGGRWYTLTADSALGLVDDRGALYLPFVGLPPGNYVLEVMASTGTGQWQGAEVRRLGVRVLPPWWATPVALSAYAVLAVALLAASFVAYGRVVRRKTARRAREDELMQRVKTLAERLSAYEGDGRVVLGEGSGQSDCRQRLTPAEAEFVSRVTAVVERNISTQGYSVEQLASDLCMERTGLYRKLTALLDKSPVAFIRSIRLRRAAEMLAGGGMSVAEVAEATGFGSTGYFSKCFQAEFGCRPSDYQAAGRRRD